MNNSVLVEENLAAVANWSTFLHQSCSTMSIHATINWVYLNGSGVDAPNSIAARHLHFASGPNTTDCVKAVFVMAVLINYTLVSTDRSTESTWILSSLTHLLPILIMTHPHPSNMITSFMHLISNSMHIISITKLHTFNNISTHNHNCN